MRIGLLGAGTVGSGLAQLLFSRPELGAVLGLALVRDADKPRPGLRPEQLTTDPRAALEGADIVVEVMGGTGLAGDLMLQALAAGKRVVTANKAALAERWASFAPYAASGTLYFEAAVMAGTPVIGPLTGALRGSRPLALHAFLNGTCSYILSEMEAGSSYQAALAEAQRLGYAEADPHLDVSGLDAAHKLTVLARLAFDPGLSWAEVKANTTGIEELTLERMQGVRSRGQRIRLVGSVTPEGGSWRAAVRPVLLPDAHPLARVAEGRNALLFQGDPVGEVLISGAGAGGGATASGVLSDVMLALSGRPGPALLAQAAPVPVLDPSALEPA